MVGSIIAHRPMRAAVVAVSLAALAGLGGCSKQSDEERARDTMEKVTKSMVDLEAIALEQKADPAVVQEVQRNLTAINEYQGEINGKIDSVTVNAIQAFQRTIDCGWWARLFARCIKDDGIIGDETRTRLAAAAQAKR